MPFDRSSICSSDLTSSLIDETLCATAKIVESLDTILFKIGRIDRVLDEDDAKIDPADRSRIKRRVTALFQEADALME